MLHAIHVVVFVFFFNDTAPTEIYTLSLHDALPISEAGVVLAPVRYPALLPGNMVAAVLVQLERHAGHPGAGEGSRSEEHTSELQSRQYLVCRLLLEKKTRAGAVAHAQPLDSEGETM